MRPLQFLSDSHQQDEGGSRVTLCRSTPTLLFHSIQEIPHVSRQYAAWAALRCIHKKNKKNKTTFAYWKSIQVTLSVTVAASCACLQAGDTQTLHAQRSVHYVLWWSGAPYQFIQHQNKQRSFSGCGRRLLCLFDELIRCTSFTRAHQHEFICLICLTWYCASCNVTTAHAHIAMSMLKRYIVQP